MKKIILIIAGLAVSSISYSAFLDNGNFSTDSITGLDWLDVTYTLGQSFDQVSSQLLPGGSLDGWRYATGREFDQLLINLGFTPGVCSNGTQFCNFSNDFQAITPPIIALLGDTSERNDPINLTENFFGWSRGLIADSLPGNDVTWLAIVDWNGLNTHHFTLANDVGDANSGSFLVRQSAVVPLPAAIWFFGSGAMVLVGLSAKHRDVKRNSSTLRKLFGYLGVVL